MDKSEVESQNKTHKLDSFFVLNLLSNSSSQSKHYSWSCGTCLKTSSLHFRLKGITRFKKKLQRQELQGRFYTVLNSPPGWFCKILALF